MKELLGDVFVGPQLLPEQVKTLREHGIATLMNNRPDMEVSQQPTSDDIAAQAAEHGIGYVHIPMSGGLTPPLIESIVEAYETFPRPIYTFCASGTRSTALWCFAHVKALGVDGVLDSAAQSGYHLEQIRGALTEYAERKN